MTNPCAWLISLGVMVLCVGVCECVCYVGICICGFCIVWPHVCAGVWRPEVDHLTS